MPPMPPLPDEEHMLALQYEECLSISLIYPDEFRLISGLACTATSTASSADADADDQDCSSLIISTCSPDELAQPIRYSVRLRPAGDDSDTINSPSSTCTRTSNALWPADPTFSLVVAYPPTYPDLPPEFSFSSAVLHPAQEEACLACLAAAVRPDLGARNPCVLTAVAAARDFFLGGHLAAGLLHAVGDDVRGHVLAHAAAEPADVDAVVEALPIFAAVGRTNPVWKQLCRRRWRTKWGFERRWRAALAEERELCLQRQDMDKGAMAAGTGSADAAAAANATWWYERYLWQEEDAKRSAMTVDELTDCAWDARQYFEPRHRNPDHMRDVLMSGLGRSYRKPFRFVMRPHPDDWADRPPLGIAKMQVLGAGPAMILEDGRCVETHSPEGHLMRWCLEKNIEDDPRPQVFAIYESRKVGARSPSVKQVRRLDTWGWEIRCTRSVFRAIDLSFMAMDGDEVEEEILASALWSDYGNIITEEKPVWIKQGGSSRHEFANYREIPDDDDLKAFLPW